MLAIRCCVRIGAKGRTPVVAHSPAQGAGPAAIALPGAAAKARAPDMARSSEAPAVLALALHVALLTRDFPLDTLSSAYPSGCIVASFNAYTFLGAVALCLQLPNLTDYDSHLCKI